MDYAQARFIADSVVAKLMPVSERVLIAGSLRRKKSEIKDIDLVIIPRRDQEKNLFGEVISTPPCPEFIELVNSWTKIKGEPTGKYCQRLLKQNIKLEISIATPDNWGNIVLIRTGDFEFSHLWMKAVLKRGLEQKEGYLYNGDKIIPVHEEEDYFKILNLPFISPENRNINAFKKWKEDQ